MFNKLNISNFKLRRISIEDADIIFEAWAQDPEITKFLTWKPHSNKEETKAYIQSALDEWEKIASPGS